MKGAMGKAVGMGIALGAVGNMLANDASKDDYTYAPLNYKCETCHKKFEAFPYAAQPDEILQQPCKIIFTRLSSFIGMFVSQSIWLNGIKIGSVKNGKTIEFVTHIKSNIIFVTDQYGMAFKTDYRFEARSGGSVGVKFKRKFK